LRLCSNCYTMKNVEELHNIDESNKERKEYERLKDKFGDSNYSKMWNELKRQIKERVHTKECDYDEFKEMDKNEYAIRINVAKRHLEYVLIDMELLEK